MGLHVPEGYHFLGEWGRAWRDPKSGLWTVAGMREGSEGRVVLSDGEARAFARLVCRDEPATFATPAENDVFCQVGVGRFGVSFSPCERRVSGRFGVGRSCWLLVIALVIA